MGDVFKLLEERAKVLQRLTPIPFEFEYMFFSEAVLIESIIHFALDELNLAGKSGPKGRFDEQLYLMSEIKNDFEEDKKAAEYAIKWIENGEEKRTAEELMSNVESMQEAILERVQMMACGHELAEDALVKTKKCSEFFSA